MFGSALLNGQALEDNVGEVCMLDSINGPMVLCDMGDLQMDINEYYDLPVMNVAEPQPNPLCDGGGLNGRPDNIVWYAFQAESTSIELRILAGSCPGGGGIQAGIYSDCTFEESVACSGSNETMINLINDVPLVIGQTYYLFIDGFMGSVCSYHIDLISPYNDYELEEIDGITAPGIALNGTICQGQQALFEVTGHNGVNYLWQIDDIVDGIVYAADTTDAFIQYQFEESGSYIVRVKSYDSCDTTDEKIFPLKVELLEREDFGTIELCGECFGSGMDLSSLNADCVLSGNLDGQDPNGDGIFGWLANTEVPIGDMEYIDTVYTPNGCYYEQRVFIEDVGISPREMIDTFVCSNEFPVEFNGQMLNENEFVRISEPGGADNGCTAYFQYTFKALDIEGHFYTACDDGAISLFFEVDQENSNVDTDQLTYQWVINGGAPSSGTSVAGVNVGDVVNLTLTPATGTCVFEFTTTLSNEDLKPDTPLIVGDLEICSSASGTKIFVNEDKDIDYVWELTDGIAYSVNESTDTITIIDPATAFDYMVKAVSCGEESAYAVGQVSVLQAPIADFSIPERVCAGSEFTIVNNSTGAGYTYDWSLDDLIFVEGNSTTGTGIYRIDQVGSYPISLTVNDGTCPSFTVEYNLEVIDLPATPDITCDNSISNEITFTWDIMPWMLDYEFTYLPEFEDNFSYDGNGTVTFSNLADGAVVNLEVVFDYGADCGVITSSAWCTAQSCPPAAISIMNNSPEICFTEDMPLVELTLSGAGNGAWDTQYVDENGVFDPNEYGVGQYDIFYNYTEDDCSYSLKTRIEVLPRPAINAFINYPECNSNAEVAEVSIFKSAGVGELTYYINGEEREGPEFMLPSGSYEVRAVDSNGCEVEDVVEVESFETTSVNIIGDASIVSYEESVFIADPSAGFIPDMYEWSWDGDIICQNDTLCIPQLSGENGIFELCLAASNVDCADTTCMDITVTTPVVLGIPNAFSPYSQTGNSQFKISSLYGEVVLNHFIVYDRYGNMMHKVEDFVVGGEMTTLWDGRYKGTVLNPGVYVYVLQYSEGDGKIVNMSGDITIVH